MPDALAADNAAFHRNPLSVLSALGGGVVQLPARETFLHQGLPVDHLYCLLEGTVKAEASDWDDRTLLICFSRPPTFFGDVEVFRDEVEATCTLTTVSPVRLWRIDRAKLKARMAETPWLIGLLARGLSEKLADRAREAARNQLSPLAARYERYLKEMGAGGIPVPISLVETASLFATSPRHLQRVIAALVERGVVARKGRNLVLMPEEAKS